MVPTTISRPDLLRLRMHAQGLTKASAPATITQKSPHGAAETAILSVLDRQFALQGQDLPGALWSIGLRAPGSRMADVQAVFDSGRYVRTWPFRGTLFVMAAQDLPWVLSLTGPRILAGAATREKNLGIDSGIIDRARDAAVGLLSGNRSALRSEMITAFEEAGLLTVPQRGYHLLWDLALEGTIVMGPHQGTHQKWVLVEDWITQRRTLEGTDAVREVVRRYLRGRGIASVADIAWWSKLRVADIRAAITDLGDSLTVFEYDGVVMWADSEAADLATQSTLPQAILLPGFDEYLLGHGQRSPALAPEHAHLTVPGGNGMFKPTVVCRGRVIGTWAKTSTARRATVTVTPFTAPLATTVERAVGTAALGYGAFRGLETALKQS